MPRLSAREVARICDGMVTGDPGAECGGFGADTRSLPADSAFVAIRSGHAHVPEAFAAGAPFALVERADCLPAGASAVVVGDVTAALGLLAAHVRSGLGARVVGITGSVGKTLTKDFIAAALSSGMKVHASPRNFNNDWGMPLTVLSCPDDAQALVVELGARGPGEIARLCRIVRPHVGVITGIGTSHIEFFGSREGIARSKSELLACLPADGLAVVPAADDFLDVLAESTPARVATVGPGGHVGAERVDLDESGHAVAVLRAGPGVKVQVRLPLPGRPLVRNAAMAVRVAMELGVGAEEAAAGIAGAKPTGWRMETTQFGGRTIVNDAYNASPASTSAGLRTVAEISRGRPMWAVLGEMAELGDTAPFEHLRMGRLAADLGYERVVAVGAGAAEIATGAGSRATRAQDAAEAAELVARESPPDAVVLVKGSLVAGLGILPSLLHKVGVGG